MNCCGFTLTAVVVASTVALLNFSCTAPPGTLEIWKRPSASTTDDRFVPEIVTVRPVRDPSANEALFVATAVRAELPGD
jgi:hypothetical protein